MALGHRARVLADHVEVDHLGDEAAPRGREHGEEEGHDDGKDEQREGKAGPGGTHRAG